jgi:hypothetical protein
MKNRELFIGLTNAFYADVPFNMGTKICLNNNGIRLVFKTYLYLCTVVKNLIRDKYK